jgi:hypothetical protein
VETLNSKEAHRERGDAGKSSQRGNGRGNKPRCASLYLVLFVAICFFIGPDYSTGQQSRPTESQVKAAYLFNFGKFVRWPDARSGADDTLEICVLGKNPFGRVLDDTVKGETIGSRKVISRTLLDLQDAAGCRILFVSSSEEGHLNNILSAAKQIGALTVSDMPHFVERGGMIEFVVQDERIRFAVNAVPVEEAGLTVSSELLKVATRVMRKGGN